MQHVQDVFAADDRVGRRVLDSLAAWPDRAGLGAEVGCRDEELLARDRRADFDHEVSLAAREAGTDPVPLVGLMEQLRIACGIRADLVQPYGVGAPCVVHRRIDDEASVRRETGPRRGVGDDVGEVFARLEVADAQRVALVALVVDAVEEPRSVGRNVESAEREELVTVGFDVAVEQHDLSRHIDAGSEGRRRPVVIGGKRCTAVDAVLLALDRPAVIPPRTLPRRHRQIGFERAPLDLLEDPLAQRCEMRRPLVGVRVLGLEVGDDVRIVLRAQPFVVVDDVVAVVGADGGTGDGLGTGSARGGHRSTVVERRAGGPSARRFRTGTDVPRARRDVRGFVWSGCRTLNPR